MFWHNSYLTQLCNSFGLWEFNNTVNTKERYVEFSKFVLIRICKKLFNPVSLDLYSRWCNFDNLIKTFTVNIVTKQPFRNSCLEQLTSKPRTTMHQKSQQSTGV